MANNKAEVARMSLPHHASTPYSGDPRPAAPLHPTSRSMVDLPLPNTMPFLLHQKTKASPLHCSHLQERGGPVGGQQLAQCLHALVRPPAQRRAARLARRDKGARNGALGQIRVLCQLDLGHVLDHA